MAMSNDFGPQNHVCLAIMYPINTLHVSICTDKSKYAILSHSFVH